MTHHHNTTAAQNNTIVLQWCTILHHNSYKYHTVQYSFGQYSIEHYQKNSGKNNNNSRLIKPNCKTNIITDGVMDFMRAIIDINQTLEKPRRGFQTLRHSCGIFSNYLKVSQYKWSFDHKGIDQRYPKLSVKVVPIIVGIFLTVTWLTSDVMDARVFMPGYGNLDDIIVHPYSIEL